LVRERGSSKTPERVIELLKEEINKIGLLKLENATGVGKSALSRYSKGIGEPTTATLERLSAYFGKSVAWLRGEHTGHDLPIVTRDVRGGIDTWDTARGYAVHELIQLAGELETPALVSEVLRLRALTGYAAPHRYEKDSDGDYSCVKMTGPIAITKGQNIEAQPITADTGD